MRDTVVVNDGFGTGTYHTHGGYWSYWNGTQYPTSVVPHKWEYVYPLDKYSYGYRRESYYYDYQSIQSLIYSLVQTVR